MGLANRITAFRIALAPVFAAVFALWQQARQSELLIVLWVVFIVSETTDVLDGWVARRLGETSPLGKLLDPFSDVLSRLTVFLCLLLVGLAPLWFFLVVLYRELSMTFLRTLSAQRGVVVAASSGGKLKAWLYFFASLAGLAQLTWPQVLGADLAFWVLQGLFAVAALASALSFAQYFAAYRRLARTSP